MVASAPYPLPTNITGLANMGEYANSLTNNFWGTGILLAGLTIMFMVLSQKYSTRTSVGTTGVLAAVLAIIWRFANQITDWVMFVFILVGFFSIVYLYFSKEEFVE